MNLLLTNDDGYNAPGLKVLAEKLSQKHNVYILGPDRNRSAVSHCLNMFSELEIKKIDEHLYNCEGFPADCAAIGLASDLFKVKFDAVVSGINCGPNLGTDIIYSGTCGAARQAVLAGVPGVAFSLDPIQWENVKTGLKYDALAEFALKNLEKLISLCNLTVPRMFINVNGASLDSYKGVKATSKLCVRTYNDVLNIVQKEGKLKSVYGLGNTGTIEDPETDFDAVQKGYVSVSRVVADPVCDNLVDVEGFSL